MEDECDETKTCVLNCDINADAIDKVIEASIGAQDLRLLIRSEGGDTDCMFAIIDYLAEMRDDGHVETVSIGEVASAAVIIAASGSQGRRLAYRHCLFAMHEPFLSGNQEDPAVARDNYDGLVLARDMYYQLLEELTGRNQHLWRCDLERRSLVWLTPMQAQNLGIIDTII